MPCEERPQLGSSLWRPVPLGKRVIMTVQHSSFKGGEGWKEEKKNDHEEKETFQPPVVNRRGESIGCSNPRPCPDPRKSTIWEDKLQF